jgi:anti-sigma factor RsiW
MTHDDVRPLLDAYLDDELDAASARAIELHVHGCEACSTWLERRRAFVAMIRAAPLRRAVPHELERRIQRDVGAPSRRTFSVSWPIALAAGALLAMSGVFVGQRLPGSQGLAEDIVSAHVRATLSPHSLDIASSDHHTVKPWLSAKLPFSPPVPELADHGDALLGGRLDYVGRTRVAALVYRHDSHSIDVFVWPAAALALPRSTAERSPEGYHVMTAELPEFRVVFVSDMSTDELAAFRDRWVALATR